MLPVELGKIELGTYISCSACQYVWCMSLA